MRKTKLAVVIFGFVSATCVNTSFAAQEIKAKEGESFQVSVSKRELTRITGKNSKIKAVWSANNVFDNSVDVDSGDVFIKPNADAPTSFSFFVKDEAGTTVTLVATQQDVPSETIIINGKKSFKSGSDSLSDGTADGRKAVVRNLMKAMTVDGDNTTYNTTALNTEIPLWRETKVVAVNAYEAGLFVGTKYLLKNISHEPLYLGEEEFLDFGADVVAVGLDHSAVKPSETTYLYVVRRLPLSN